jgi:hypothetical protein
MRCRVAGTLAGTVAADDPNHLAALDLEGNILQRPDLAVVIPLRAILSSKRGTETAEGGGGDSTGQGIAQCLVPLRPRTDAVELSDVLHTNGDVTH